MSSYNKNNLFGVKGRIGELIVANYLNYAKGIQAVETPTDQVKGIDLDLISGNLKLRVDVKLSDKLGEYFSYTYQNASNVRHPNRMDSALDRVVVNTYDWKTYVAANVVKLATKTREEVKKLLAEYIEVKDLAELITAIEGKKKTSDPSILSELTELYIAHRTCDKLEKEYQNPNEVAFKNTKQLFEKGYVVSIKSIPALRLSNLTFFFKNDPMPGTTLGDKLGPIVRKQTYWTRFGPITAAEVYWRAVEEDVEAYYEIADSAPTGKQVPQVLRNHLIAFGKHAGTPVRDLETKYLRWLCTDAKFPGPLLDEFKEELASRTK